MVTAAQLKQAQVGSGRPERNPEFLCAQRLVQLMDGHAEAWGLHCADPDGTADEWDQHLIDLGRVRWWLFHLRDKRRMGDETCHRGRPFRDDSCGCDWHEFLHQAGEFAEGWERASFDLYRREGGPNAEQAHRIGMRAHSYWLRKQ